MLPGKRKGICRLSVVPVRNQDNDQSEMVTQLLFGDHYEVIGESENNNWLQIKIAFDGYEGWIDKKQYIHISDEFFEQINNSDNQISTDLISQLSYKQKDIHLLLGSMLPFSDAELFQIKKQLNFEGSSKAQSIKMPYSEIKKIAFQFLNAPYLWGGKTHFGIDCSGFTQMVFKICGYSLLRDAGLQVNQGEPINGLNDALGGDLAFFAKKDNKVYHVGIILDENSIIHASGFVRVDKLDEKGIYNEEMNCYTHKLFSIKRILKR